MVEIIEDDAEFNEVDVVVVVVVDGKVVDVDDGVLVASFCDPGEGVGDVVVFDFVIEVVFCLFVEGGGEPFFRFCHDFGRREEAFFFLVGDEFYFL